MTSELIAFVAMLERAGIGHGMRADYDPPGTAVMVETGDGEGEFTITEFGFDGDGKLTDVVSYPGDQG
jgi:hypothetical protein